MILHVDSGHEWRGGQQQLLYLASRQSADCAVALPGDSPLKRHLESAGVSTIALPHRGVFGGAKALCTVIERVKPSLVAAHTSHAHADAVKAVSMNTIKTSAARPPVVVHRRVDFRPNWMSKGKYLAADGFVAVSGAVRNILLETGVSGERVAVVHDGVDDVVLPPVTKTNSGVIIGCVGALVPHKDHATFIRALSRVMRVRPEIRGVLVGEGPCRASLEELAERLGVSGRLTFVGQSNRARERMASFNLMCHPSREEGMGQVLVEAMLAGVPVVATTAGGIPDVVEHGVTGLLVPPRRPARMAGALLQALDDSERTERRARVARLRALEQFSIDAMVRGTEAFYERVLTSV